MSERENLAAGQAESMRELLTEVWAAIDADEEYEGQDAREYLDEMPLEVVWEHGTPFAVVLGTGGPHVEVTQDTRGGGASLEVYWGSDRATLRGDAISRTADYFREYVDETGGY